MEIKDGFMVLLMKLGILLPLKIKFINHYINYIKAHPKETVLGWFGSSNQIDDITSLIHDFYSKGLIEHSHSLPYI